MFLFETEHKKQKLNKKWKNKKNVSELFLLYFIFLFLDVLIEPRNCDKIPLRPDVIYGRSLMFSVGL